MKEVFSYLEKEHKLLSRAELLKLALAQLYRHTQLVNSKATHNIKELKAVRKVDRDAFNLGLPSATLLRTKK